MSFSIRETEEAARRGQGDSEAQISGNRLRKRLVKRAEEEDCLAFLDTGDS